MQTNKNNLKVRTQQIRQQIENLLNDRMLYNNFFSTIYVLNETETEIIIDFTDLIAKQEVISRWVDTVEKAIKNLEISKILTFNNTNNYTINSKES
ncbi:chromosomal replication initiation protein DnaA, partial [Mesomycoplasma hyopneumoniae]